MAAWGVQARIKPAALASIVAEQAVDADDDALQTALRDSALEEAERQQEAERQAALLEEEVIEPIDDASLALMMHLTEVDRSTSDRIESRRLHAARAAAMRQERVRVVTRFDDFDHDTVDRLEGDSDGDEEAGSTVVREVTGTTALSPVVAKSELTESELAIVESLRRRGLFGLKKLRKLADGKQSLIYLAEPPCEEAGGGRFVKGGCDDDAGDDDGQRFVKDGREESFVKGGSVDEARVDARLETRSLILKFRRRVHGTIDDHRFKFASAAEAEFRNLRRAFTATRSGGALVPRPFVQRENVICMGQAPPGRRLNVIKMDGTLLKKVALAIARLGREAKLSHNALKAGFNTLILDEDNSTYSSVLFLDLPKATVFTEETFKADLAAIIDHFRRSSANDSAWTLESLLAFVQRSFEEEELTI